jgi:hypothetical protein
LKPKRKYKPRSKMDHVQPVPRWLIDVMLSWYKGMTLNAYSVYHSEAAGVNRDCVKRVIDGRRRKMRQSNLKKLEAYFGRLGMMEDSDA